MKRPRYEVAQIIRTYGQDFVKAHPQSAHHLRTLQALAKCRTAALGDIWIGVKAVATSASAITPAEIDTVQSVRDWPGKDGNGPEKPTYSQSTTFTWFLPSPINSIPYASPIQS